MGHDSQGGRQRARLSAKLPWDWLGRGQASPTLSQRVCCCGWRGWAGPCPWTLAPKATPSAHTSCHLFPLCKARLLIPGPTVGVTQSLGTAPWVGDSLLEEQLQLALRPCRIRHTHTQAGSRTRPVQPSPRVGWAQVAGTPLSQEAQPRGQSAFLRRVPPRPWGLPRPLTLLFPSPRGLPGGHVLPGGRIPAEERHLVPEAWAVLILNCPHLHFGVASGLRAPGIFQPNVGCLHLHA